MSVHEQAQQELKKAVESFDRNAPRNPKSKEMRKVESGFLDHPKIQRLMKAAMRDD